MRGRQLSDLAVPIVNGLSGVAAEKLLTTNIAEGRVRLVATSGSRYLGMSKDEREAKGTANT